VSELVVRTQLTILSGDDSLTLPMLSVGAEGVVSVIANLIPRDVIALLEAFQSGRVDDARQRHARLFPLCRDLLGLAPNPVPVKTALALLSRGNGELRLPLCPLDDRSNESLRNSLARYGLLTGRL
jgi:4-hydroxy-tetrahydrodipicolinate synthase